MKKYFPYHEQNFLADLIKNKNIYQQLKLQYPKKMHREFNVCEPNLKYTQKCSKCAVSHFRQTLKQFFTSYCAKIDELRVLRYPTVDVSVFYCKMTLKIKFYQIYFAKCFCIISNFLNFNLCFTFILKQNFKYKTR